MIITSISDLKKGEQYHWTAGADPELKVEYIGTSKENPNIKPGSSVGKGYIFKFIDKTGPFEYVEVGRISIYQGIIVPFEKHKRGAKIKSHIYKRGKKINSFLTPEMKQETEDLISLKSNYPRRTPEWIWDNWTEEQRLHFLRDHVNHLNDKTKKILLITNYENLRPSIKNEINNHVIEGRYEHGTKIESTNERNENYYENVVNELLNDNAIATIRMKTYGCEIQPYSPVDDAYMLPIKLTRSDLLALIIKSNVEFMNYDEKQIVNELTQMTKLLMKK